MSQEKKPSVDWDLIEIDYRAGVKTLEQMGLDHGVTKGRISQVAKKKGWTRDINAKIKAKADAKVNEAAVNAKLNEPKRRLAEQDVVEANAELQYRVRMEHRRDIGRTRSLFVNLLGELEDITTKEGQRLAEEMFELLAPQEDEDNTAAMRRYENLRKKFDQVVGMSGRIDSAKKLTEMLEKLVKMERDAFGIKDEGDKGSGGYEDLLAQIGGGIR